MITSTEPVLREQLEERRMKLITAIEHTSPDSRVLQLLQEVDAAIERMNKGLYGLCEVCHDAIETERLIADPLVRFCLGDLTSSQRRALEEDLQLAARLQSELLPCAALRLDGWECAYHYEPAGPVSGDYCDLVRTEDGGFYFVLGDVSGKGIAAAMLMNQLHAMFRSLIAFDLPLGQLLERVSRVFCESTLPTHFATLVCGRVYESGEIELGNAGHLPPLLLHDGAVTLIEPTGLPVGIFCNEQFSTVKLPFAKGDTLILYTDGLTETQDAAGGEYGAERLVDLIGRCGAGTCEMLIKSCLEEVSGFRSNDWVRDDLTIMAIRRAALIH